MSRKRIGLPRALLFYKYGIMWKTFFEKLGYEVVISDKTNKNIMDDSLKIALDEFCLPVKLMYGHVLNLKGKVDYMFIPKYVSVLRGTVTCPRLIALPEIIKYMIKDLPLLTLTIKNKYQFIPFFILGLKLGKNPIQIVRAYKTAQSAYKSNKRERENAFILRKDKLNIAVISHLYNLDEYTTLNLLKKLEDREISVMTIDMINKYLIEDELKKIHPLYWSEEQEVFGAGLYAINNKDIDGIIMIHSFLCGPDSLVGDDLLLKIKESKKPVLQLILDESTTEKHLLTRIDSFINVTRIKKGKDGFS